MTTSPNAIVERLNVSRETLDRLALITELLEKWNPKINLVSKTTLDDIWNRHILDSIEVYECALNHKEHGVWVDIGSGGGFPGLVVAMLNAEAGYPWRLSMIESDVRKCTFLRTVLRETGVQAVVETSRIEESEPQNADILSARALSDLSKLLEFSDYHLKLDGTAIFPKGTSWKKEVLEAQKTWNFKYEVTTSDTQPGSVILNIEEIERV